MPPRSLPLVAHTPESGPEDAVWPSAWWLPHRGSGLAPLLRDNMRQVVPSITSTPNPRRNETHRVAAFPSPAAGPKAIVTPPDRARFAYCARQTGRSAESLRYHRRTKANGATATKIAPKTRAITPIAQSAAV